MSFKTVLLFTVLSIFPISELRGAIPFGVASGMPLPVAFLAAIILNGLVPIIGFLFLDTLHSLLLKMLWYRKLFTTFSERTLKKIHPGVEKYGYWGLFVFVAIPLPVTGAWTGTLGAWLLGMERKRSIAMIVLGVISAGIIVSLILFLGLKGFEIFIKKI